MAITDINAFCNKAPKPEGGIGEDGDYFVRFGLGEVKSVSNGASELLEIPFTVTEGESAGNEGEIVLFYQQNDEWNEKGLERIKKVANMVDPYLLSAPSFSGAMLQLIHKLNGRIGKVNQNTFKGRTYLNILEVFDAGSIPQQPTYNHSQELLTESDIAF